MKSRNELGLSKAQTKDLARKMACYACEMDPSGNFAVAVTDRRARGALQRAYTQLLRRGGRPSVIQISQREAEGFPSQSAYDGKMCYALAAGLDVNSMPSFAIQGVAPVLHNPENTPGRIVRMADATAADMAAARAKADLMSIIAVPGLSWPR